MGQRDTDIVLQQLPTGWSLYNGGDQLRRYGSERPAFSQVMADAGVRGGYWRQTRWRPGKGGCTCEKCRICTQYRWVEM